MADASRSRAKELGRQAVAAGDSSAWFEPLYQEADGDDAKVPWADNRPNPLLVDWLSRQPNSLGRVVVVGCGLGDDAEAVRPKADAVVAFDLSPTAVVWCRRRWSDSTVNYVVADAAEPPGQWLEAFDLVIESYTLQAICGQQRDAVLQALPTLLAPGGKLLVICRGRDEAEPADGPPWPLAKADLAPLEQRLELDQFEDLPDPVEPSVRRFRILYKRR